VTRVAGFDALRAVSVTLVILTHIGVVAAVNGPFYALNGQTGVRTFFVLSGFLITILLIAEHERTGRIRLRAFAVRRVLRIVPLYLLVTATALVLLELAGIAVKAGTLAFVLTYTYNFVPEGYPVDLFNHYWSLSVEEHFYLAWPAIMLMTYGRNPRLLKWGCALFVMVSLVLLQAGWVNRWTIPAAFPIAIGCWSALMATQLRPIFRTPASLAWSLALLMAPVALADAPGQAASALGSAGVILWVFHNQDRVAVQLMDWGPIGYLGTISYGLYLWQGIFTWNGFSRPAGIFPPADPVLALFLTLACAIVSWHLYERPIIGLRTRFRASTTVTAVVGARADVLAGVES
jgi:peptidoglycan/LPS O-acetylase OafA/YrhL